jgi:hypothetical protein
VNGEK